MMKRLLSIRGLCYDTSDGAIPPPFTKSSLSFPRPFAQMSESVPAIRPRQSYKLLHLIPKMRIPAILVMQQKNQTARHERPMPLQHFARDPQHPLTRMRRYPPSCLTPPFQVP